MRRFTLFISIGLLVAACLALSSVHAQAPTANSAISDLEKTIRECEQQVAGWQSEARIEIGFVVAIIVFGALVTALQKSDSKWATATTVVLGVVIAILTGINSRVFTADDRTLRRAVFEGKAVIAQLRGIADTLKDEHLTEQDRLSVKGDYLKKLLEFKVVGEKLNGVTASANMNTEGSGFWALPRVYAQSVRAVPTWVQKTPSDDVSLYYVGTGYAASLSNAKQTSMNDAVSHAVQALRLHAPNASDADLAVLVKASAVVQDVSFAYDEKAGNYTYYTLLRLSKEIGNVGLTSLPAASNAQSPAARFQSRGWQPGDLTSNPSSGLFVLDSGGGVSRLVVDHRGLTPIEALFRLKVGDSGSALAASADSVLVASNSKLGCTVFKYAITSRVVSQRLVAVRERCVGIATDGPRFYVTIPDRKEIRYWDSWDALSAHSWNFVDIDLPSYLVFDDIGHRLILTDVSGNAYAISVPDGKKQLLASNLGSVMSIAASRFHILVASGKKVLFLDRSDGHGENPPAGLQSLTGGHIVGVAVDGSDRLWFADFDNKLVEGPFPLS